jgi:hypothetical protein
LIQISLPQMEIDEQTCRDGSVGGFGRRLRDRLTIDAAIPDELLALIAILEREAVVSPPLANGRVRAHQR